MSGVEVFQGQDLHARMTPDFLRDQIEAVEELVRTAVLRDGHDYGRIPGTPKPTLFKSGAERLLMWARLGHRVNVVELERDDEGRKYGVTYRCTVHALDNPNVVVGECDGYCGYDEPDREAHKNKWGKPVERSPWNTVIKMAQKRALVGATLQATGTSSLFTQDLEDMASAAVAGGARNDDLGDVAKLTNRQVVDALKERDLPLAGKPDELRARLAEAIGQEPAQPEGEANGSAEPAEPAEPTTGTDADPAVEGEPADVEAMAMAARAARRASAARGDEPHDDPRNAA